MAMSKISLPSFDFTEDEKVENQNYVNYLLHRSLELLDGYKKKSTVFDLYDAAVAVEDALAIAKDPGACESPPLAKCYLNQGHILEAMENYAEARSAYQKAARAPSYSALDRAASEQAAYCEAQIEQNVRDGRRKGGLWPDIYQPGSSNANPVQSPNLREVGARKPSIERPRIHNLQRSQHLAPCHEGWMTEAVSTPGLDHRGMLLPTSPLRSFKEHLAIRSAATKKS
ncbi:uncharacterized protein F4807DRAFT_216815 [Annulohypoxylon truncatum]|uniref:uncharacterized protein n=1 Tax=Annulohypoxylon truncatum TaxID=327061 RepID=UPI002007E84B|nr:uncharacterized protein F4807DRAFT_216815 [Annulohypoxylon truncatum]KAI1206847.1 hypothetical protein F4807DRAFT_216815 [Annulohypoxylon truncatum]